MVNGLIRQRDEIDEMQYDFTSGRDIKYAFLMYVTYRRIT